MVVRKKLGELLVESQLITAEQLNQALRSKKPGERLGQVLVSLGYVTEQDIINVLEFQLGIPQIKLSELSLELNVVRLLPESIARRYNAIPVKLNDGYLTVAMVDPLNVVALDDIRLTTGYEIEPAIATEEEITRALAEYYGLQDLADKVLQELEISQVVERPELVQLGEGASDGNEAPVVRVVNSIIQQAIKTRASDIHLEPQEDKVRVRFRVDGLLRENMALPKNSAASIVSRVKIMAEMDIAEKRVPQDGRIQLKVEGREIDLRVSSLPTIFGEKIVMRILDKSSQLISLNKLGFRPELLNAYINLINIAYGMILVTGPTGSGKTTTLYATLNEINTAEKNIVTIEDPVEYVLEGINQIGVNTKAGLTFATGLRSILRQDPDVIMVGEIRDGETADIAVRAATTGHLVFSTLHTNDAAGALPRLIDMGAEPFLVASSVAGVVAQRLVRVICPKCKKAYQVPPGAAERLFLAKPEGDLTIFKGVGCRECGNTGYKGRMAIHEVLHVTREIRELIMEKAPAETIKQQAVKQGMVTLKEDGVQKVLCGLTTVEEVMRVAYSETASW